MSNIWKIIAAAGLALLIAGGLFDLTADGSTLICRGFRFTHEKEEKTGKERRTGKTV